LKRRWMIWLIMLSLVLQLAVYALLNWKADQLLNPSLHINQVYVLKTDLSQADSFMLSYNKKFLAYQTGRYLEVIDLTTNTKIFAESPEKDTAKIVGFAWLPDRNGMVYLIREQNKNAVTSLYSVDFSTGSSELNSFKPMLDRELSLAVDQVLQIEMSTYTNKLFILFKDDNQTHQLITMDIMKTLNRVNQQGEEILNIAVSNKFGSIYAESRMGMNKTIDVYQAGSKNHISVDPEDTLLGCRDDKIYVGKISGNILQEVTVYQVQPSGPAMTETVVWQGEIPYAETETKISNTNQVMIKSKGRLDVISANGKHQWLRLPDVSATKSNTVIILAPTGDLYLELLPGNEKSVYYWREV